MPQVTTLTFFKYKTLVDKLWAFKMMQFAHAHMSKVDGLEFYKLMGSGKGLGFNPLPDWSVYAILQVWKSAQVAEQYFAGSLHQCYVDHTQNIWTLYLENIAVKGTWSGGNPFTEQVSTIPNKPLAIITRATIKTSQLYHFWKYVPSSQKGLADNDGLIFTKGIGEIPLIQMATFSLWQNEEKLKEFAYSGKAHKKAIELTRSRNWYSEEMFARFQVLKTEGSWDDVSFP